MAESEGLHRRPDAHHDVDEPAGRHAGSTGAAEPAMPGAEQDVDERGAESGAGERVAAEQGAAERSAERGASERGAERAASERGAEFGISERGAPYFDGGAGDPAYDEPEVEPDDEDDEDDDVEARATDESTAERLRRRAAFLRDLAEARELRDRVSPRRTRVLRLRETRRRSTYHQST